MPQMTTARIVERLFDEKAKISFGESVERTGDGTFAPDVVTDASAKIATMAEQNKQATRQTQEQTRRLEELAAQLQAKVSHFRT